jgi:hypothetical protein
MGAMKEQGFRKRLLLAVGIDYLFNHDADYAQG